MNSKNELDYSSFERALSSLQRGVDRAKKAPTDEELRDAVIQRFEYSYELAWKMIKRQLELEAPTPADIDALSFKALMRDAAEKGMIDSFTPWLVYREQRNIIAHTYDQKKAESVYLTAVEFLPVAKRLLECLKARSHD